MNNKAPKEHTNSLNRHQATCTRTDRDLYRICPSKLSRRELENLYFTLLENNIDLKKNLNLQHEKIKTLSAKVQRLSYPRNVNGVGKDSPGTTAIVNEQKDSIIQLKRANERMAERIRVLNMKLCSVKQFVGKNKANNLNNATLSSSNTKSNCTGSCANLVTAGPSKVKTNSVGNQTDYFAEKYSNSSCDIKCKPTINELNEKINNLQEELQKSQQRIEKLEALVMRLQGENQTVRAEHAASEHALQQQDAQLEDLKEKLRCAEAKVNDMNMELTIEKKKLAELETELKLTENFGNILSSSVTKTIEETDQKTVGGEANTPTDEAKLIRDEVNVASDEVPRTQDKVQFIRGELINVARNELHRVSDDVDEWGDAMARNEMDTEPEDKILTRGEKGVATNEVNKLPEDQKINQGEEIFTTKEVNKVTDDITLTRVEENVATIEDMRASDDLQYIRGEPKNVSSNEGNRVPEDVEYNWGNFMAGTRVDTVADDKRLNNNDVNVARKEVNKVPSGTTLTRDEENVARNEDSSAPEEFKRGELINVTTKEENRVSIDVDYDWGDFMAGTQVNTVAGDKKLNNDEVKVARNDVYKVPSGITLTTGEENVARNEDSTARDEFKRGELINVTTKEENRVSNDVDYDWGDFMAGTQVDTVAGDKKLNNDEVKVARNDVYKVPSGITLTRSEENVARNEVEKIPEEKEMKKDKVNMAMNEVKKLPYDNKNKSDEKNVPRNEVKNSKDEVKSLVDHPSYREQQDLNKNIETEKDQPNIKLNQELINKISELVSQLEMIKITAAGEPYTVTDKIVKEKPTDFTQHDVKTKKPDAISAPVHKQNVTQKSYDVKANETDKTSSQAKKEKPMQSKSYEAKPRKGDYISLPINKQNPTQYKPCDVKIKKTEGTSCSTSINKQNLTQKSYDDKTKETGIISSQINTKKNNQFESYTGKTEAIDNISIRNDKDKPMKYEYYDVKTEVDDILNQKNKDKPTIYASNYVGSKEDDDFESQMKKKLAEYESIDVTTKEADNILSNISNANPPKYESYDFETKESDDILTKTNDTIECILEVKSANERNKFTIQEPVSTYEVKGMRNTEQKRIDYPTIPVDHVDSSHQQSIEKLSLVSMAQELKSKSIPKLPQSDDGAHQIPGPIHSDLNDQKREVSGDHYSRNTIDGPSEKITDSYRKRPNKMPLVEKSKQVGSFSERPLKTKIDEKSAKSEDSYGEIIRKRSLEEKSEKIRKSFSEPPNRISFQQMSEDNMRKPNRGLTRQSFDEKVMKISDTDDGERPVRKSIDPLSTRPSICLSDKATRTSLYNSSNEALPFDIQPRLSLSAKTASIIKDYARDVEAKSRKVRQRFSKPCATVIETPDPSRFLLPTESILKSKDAATSSSCIREPGVYYDSPSTGFGLNMDVGGYADGQENAGVVPSTVAHMKDVDEPIVICGASATVCVCPPSEPRGVSAFRTCTGNIRFRTTQPQDNIRHCTCRVKALDQNNCGMGAGSSSQRNSGTSMDNKAPKTYSVVGKQSRATSPDNTDHEISSMTDWASEKDGQRSPAQTSIEIRARFDSLSEERGTTTGTDGPSEHYTTASEGEVPAGLTSLGERYPGVGPNQRPQQDNKNDTMEATLQSISKELARCRKLLLSQRSQEKGKSLEHALRRSRASRQLSTTYTPVCVFTLHIGTLVLSDDTVVWSRDKNLVLMWKFYSQSTAMTRVQPGRVAIFDFVTEYDVVLNDDMLNYMKNSEMAIVLCELGKEEKPFAKCWLPLQEALLHANRRADMSLALVPCQTEDSDNRQTFGEEVGVLDLWCSLRLDKSLLPTIDRAMHKPSSNDPEWHMESAAPRESRIIQQAAEDETSRESSLSRQSRDFALGRLTPRTKALSRTVEPPRHSYSEYPTGSFSRNFYVPGQDIPCHASERYADDVSVTHTEEEQQQPRHNFHSFSSPAPKTQFHYGNRERGGYDRWSTPEHQASGIIINEVPANIRTDNDMREALEQKVQQDDSTMWPKMEDYDSSLRHSSFGSVRSLAARHQLAKLKYPQKHKPDYVATESFQDILNKDKQYIPNVEGSDPNFSRTANANKYIGVPGIYKLAEASRKSVKYSKSVEHEPPKTSSTTSLPTQQMIEITILWLALNEECEAMANPNIKRLYVAYSFLGRKGADLETPFSLPKPKHYADKCYFNFKKTFYLNEGDLPLLGHMAMCRSGSDATTDPRDCVVFTLVSEPPEDPLGLSSCEDVGYAYLYLGDVLAYSGGSNGYTEVVGVRGVRDGVCGVLAVRVDNLAVLRLGLTLKP